MLWSGPYLALKVANILLCERWRWRKRLAKVRWHERGDFGDDLATKLAEGKDMQ